jgi:hypothetical protein
MEIEAPTSDSGCPLGQGNPCIVLISFFCSDISAKAVRDRPSSLSLCIFPCPGWVCPLLRLDGSVRCLFNLIGSGWSGCAGMELVECRMQRSTIRYLNLQPNVPESLRIAKTFH